MGLGNESILGKKYLVYFVKSQFSKVEDDAWICAGAIVSPTQILTAAACLVDVDRIYAIAGYKKYVHGSDIENDECTKRWKKKIVKVSVPKEYNMATDKQPDWMNIDLGVATVDEPYNFTDIYPSNCSYEPQSITINYDKKNELENIRATALGWGGIKDRQPKELTKPQKKPQILKEASTIIINKTVCIDLIKGNVSKEVLNEYILCASGNGMVIDEGEETSVDTRPYAPDECPYNSSESGCGDAYYEELRRRQNEKINATIEQPELHRNSNNKTNSRRTPLIETCQNDHGGPLTTWIGTEEMVLGVALNGISNPNFDCVGPRIYVSTAETAKIIKCLLETNETK
uniref:SFRICE_005933 n=1 Tax=Spodoptera frugiperda TaxID=7108 RepID=A0A2H1W4V6_SPOFR